MKNLASKYRPNDFDSVVGQEVVLDIFANQIENDELKQAYLLTGGAGTGKTTCGRILANVINKGKGNPIEVDAASNNGVDNIRDIIDESKSHSIDSQFKVFIIDEVHMLSIGAFNALLKTLEEPPKHSVFILCTTDPQKIPATILSRVQRFDFTRISLADITEQLTFILESENEEFGDIYTWEDDALEYIAKLADGGMRDAITRLETVLSYTQEVTMDSTVSALGTPDYKKFVELIEAIVNNYPATCIRLIQDIHESGKDLKLAMRNFNDFILDLCKYSLTSELELTAIPSTHVELIDETLALAGDDLLLWLLEEMNNLNSVIKWEPNAKPMIEAKLILMAKSEQIDEGEE